MSGGKQGGSTGKRWEARAQSPEVAPKNPLKLKIALLGVISVVQPHRAPSELRASLCQVQGKS